MVLTHADYTVGWISATPLELAAAKAMLDKPLHPILEQDIQDTNTYTLGQIGKHNIVLAIPSTTGIGPAAHAAGNLLRSFPSIRFGLMVGIGGGVPGVANSMPDIRLGDVVVSYPEEKHGGVVQYDFGAELQLSVGSRFVRKGHLNKPPPILLTGLRNLQANVLMEPFMIQKHYENMLENYPMMSMKYFRPENDELYSSEHLHCGRKYDCSQCSKEKLVTRTPRTTSVIHYGLIGSANTLLRSATTRDRLRDDEQIMCVEMEAAGLMNEFPCVVIRGISDYCDSHKSDQWQAYSSAIAAAYAKELLLNIAPTSVNNLPQLDSLIHLTEKQLHEAQEVNRSLGHITSKLDSAKDIAARAQHKKRLKDLKCVHPQIDKARLEDIKGGLLRDVYKWILQTNEYMSWQRGGGLLWIKGDPGKGKTMLTCGIIDELKEYDMAYFFCQATADTNNTAISVLRGLIYAALHGDAPLSEALSDQITQAGELPQESAFYIYSNMILEILNSKNIVILIDALDECLSGRDRLLRFIVKCSVSHSSRWLVTSRNYSDIGNELGRASQLSLELNEDSVSDAVRVFIEHKVQELNQTKGYDDDLRTSVLQHLLDNAKGTFLWVSLVCLRLAVVRPRHTKSELLRYQPGLETVYSRMLNIIEEVEDADKLKQILSLLCITFRPVTLDELSSLIDFSGDNMDYLEDMVIDCGSFLSIRKSTIEFIHQSAKEFLVKHDVISRKKIDFHHQAFTKSLDALYSLQRNMYSLTDPRVSLDDIQIPDPDPLKDVRYAGVYWADHLLQVCDSSSGGIDAAYVNLVSSFLEKKALYWIELLSLLGQVYPATSTLSKLQSATQACGRYGQLLSPDSSKLETLIDDTIQFLRYFQYALLRFPLQVYISGLLFCPSQSLIRDNFEHEKPKWTFVERGLEESWPDHLPLNTLTRVMQWSDDARKLATRAQKINIWDANSGQLLTALPGDGWEFAFIKSGTVLLVVDACCPSIKLWSTTSGELLETKPFKSSRFPPEPPDFSLGSYNDLTISNDTSLVAHSHTSSLWVEVHCTDSGSLMYSYDLKRFWQERFVSKRLVLSGDNSFLAIGVRTIILLLDVKSGKYLWNKFTSGSFPGTIAFSPCSTMLAIAKHDGCIKFEIWDWRNDQLIWLLPDVHDIALFNERRLVFLQDRILVANGTEIKELSLKSPSKERICASLSTTIVAISADPGGQKIAVTDEFNVKIWTLDRLVGTVAVTDHVHDVSLRHVWLKEEFAYTISNSNVTKIRQIPVAMDEKPDIILSTPESGTHRFVGSISPNRSYVAIWTEISLDIWNLGHGNRVLRVNYRDGAVAGMAWGPDDTQVTIARRGSSNYIACCSISENPTMRQLPYPPRWKVASANFKFYMLWSSKGSYLLISCKLGLCLWIEDQKRWSNVGDGNELLCLDGQTAFSIDESLFACVTGSGGVKLFETDTQRVLFSIQEERCSASLQFDSDWLKTDNQWYAIQRGSTSNNRIVATHPAEHLNIGPVSDSTWVRSGTDDIIWLPPDYRAQRDWYDIDGSRIAIGRNATQVVILNVHWDRSKGLDSKGPWANEPASNHKRRRSSLAIHTRQKKDRHDS